MCVCACACAGTCACVRAHVCVCVCACVCACVLCIGECVSALWVPLTHASAFGYAMKWSFVILILAVIFT